MDGNIAFPEEMPTAMNENEEVRQPSELAEQVVDTVSQETLEESIELIISAQLDKDDCSVFSNSFIFSDLPPLPVDLLIDVVDEVVEARYDEESWDRLKGQVLAYGCLIFSKVFENANEDDILIIVNKIIDAYSEITLKQHVLNVLVKVTEEIDVNIFVESVWDSILYRIIVPSMLNEDIYVYHLLLVLNKMIPAVVSNDFLIGIVDVPQVVHDDTIDKIVFAMVADLEYRQFISKSVKVVLQEILENKSILVKMWQLITNWPSVKENVDENVECPEPKLNKKFVFQLFAFIIQRIKNKCWIRHLLLHKFVLNLITTVEGELNDHRLNAISTLTDIVVNEIAVLNDHTQMMICQKLIISPGTLKFMFGAGKELITFLFRNFNVNNLEHFASLFYFLMRHRINLIIENKSIRMTFESVQSILKNCNAQQNRIYDKLISKSMKQICSAAVRILHNPVMNCKVVWKYHILAAIFDQAFYVKKQTPAETKFKKERFIEGLNTISKHDIEDQEYLVSHLLHYIDDRLKDKLNSEIFETEEVVNCWLTAMKMYQDMEEKKRYFYPQKLPVCVFVLTLKRLTLMLILKEDFTVPLLKVFMEFFFFLIKKYNDRAENHEQRNIDEMFEESLSEITDWYCLIPEKLSSLELEKQATKVLIAMRELLLVSIKSEEIETILSILGGNPDVSQGTDMEQSFVSQETEKGFMLPYTGSESGYASVSQPTSSLDFTSKVSLNSGECEYSEEGLGSENVLHDVSSEMKRISFLECGEYVSDDTSSDDRESITSNTSQESNLDLEEEEEEEINNDSEMLEYDDDDWESWSNLRFFAENILLDDTKKDFLLLKHEINNADRYRNLPILSHMNPNLISLEGLIILSKELMFEKYKHEMTAYDENADDENSDDEIADVSNEDFLKYRIVRFLGLLVDRKPLVIIFQILDSVFSCLKKLVLEGGSSFLKTWIRFLLTKVFTIENMYCKNSDDCRIALKLLNKFVCESKMPMPVYLEIKDVIIRSANLILKTCMIKEKIEVSETDFEVFQESCYKLYKDSLIMYFVNKVSFIPLGIFQKALQLPWFGAFQLGLDTVYLITGKNDDFNNYVCSLTKSDVLELENRPRPWNLNYAFILLDFLLKNKVLYKKEMDIRSKTLATEIVAHLVENMDVFKKFENSVRCQYVQLLLTIKTTYFCPEALKDTSELRLNELLQLTSRKNKSGKKKPRKLLKKSQAQANFFKPRI